MRRVLPYLLAFAAGVGAMYLFGRGLPEAGLWAIAGVGLAIAAGLALFMLRRF